MQLSCIHKSAIILNFFKLFDDIINYTDDILVLMKLKITKKVKRKVRLSLCFLIFICSLTSKAIASDEIKEASIQARLLFFVSEYSYEKKFALDDLLPCFQICFIGNNEYQNLTRKILEQLKVNQLSIKTFGFKNLKQLSILSPCELIVIGKLKQDYLDTIRKQLEKFEELGWPTVSINSKEQYKGIYILENNEIKINTKKIQRYNFESKLSPQLLSVVKK